MAERLLVLVVLASCSGPPPTAVSTNAPTREIPSSEAPAPENGAARAPDVPRAPLEGSWTDLGALGDEDHPPRRVRVWMPELDRTDASPVPALVVLDGQGAEEWFALPDAIQRLYLEGRVDAWAVIAIDASVDRDRELRRTGPSFVDFVIETILPAARSALPLAQDREHTAILGYSYGGLQAAVAMARRGDVFGRAIVQSPSLWVEDRRLTEAFRRGSSALPARIWIDVGTHEPDDDEIIPYMVRDARALRDAAVGRGMVLGRTLGYFEAAGEGHDIRAAARRIAPALAFALGEVDLTTETPVTLTVSRLRAVHGRTTFTVEVGYPSGGRLTVPAGLVTVLAAGAPVRGEIVEVGRPLAVQGFGLEARCE